MDGPDPTPELSESAHSSVVDSTPRSPTIRWHPKLTVYRALILSLTAGFGLAKAILTYRDQMNGSITVDWVFGVLVFLLFYWLGVQEANNPDAAPWLFQSDLAPLMWKALRCSSTNYVTEERDLTMLIKQPHPPLTGYRLLLSFLVTIFGLTKAILTYIGGKTMPNTIDWVFGVVVTIGLYWLGLYERSSPATLPKFFETDYTVVIARVWKGGSLIGLLLLHIPAMGLELGWTHLWISGLVQLWTEKAPDLPTSAFDRASMWTVTIFWSTGACVAVVAGVAGCIIVFLSFMKFLAPVAKPLLARFTSCFASHDAEDVDGGSLPWFTLAPLRLPDSLTHPTGRTKTILVASLMILLALAACLGWSLFWVYTLVQAWTAILAGGEGSFFAKLFLWSFMLIWSGGAGVAIGAGVTGCFFVLRSLVSPLSNRSHRGYTSLFNGNPV